MIATHYQIGFPQHYLAGYIATRGIGFLGWNARFRGFASSFLLDHALVDVGVGVRWLSEVHNVETLCCWLPQGGGCAREPTRAWSTRASSQPNVSPTASPPRARAANRLTRSRNGSASGDGERLRPVVSRPTGH
jgi:hypothetical protein